MMARDEGEDSGDDAYAEQVPPDRDVREKGHHPHPEGVQEAVNDEDTGVDDEDVAGRRRVVRVMLRNEAKKKAKP